MSIIAVIQQKGGVGKSTITANLAAELVHAKRSVVLLDLDPQQSLTHWAQLGSGLLKAAFGTSTSTSGSRRPSGQQ